jgi:hypothetical protein
MPGGAGSSLFSQYDQDELREFTSMLTVSVVLWLQSSLRFQAEMGLLMAIWLFVSGFSALFTMPAMVSVFRPEFIVGKRSGSKYSASAELNRPGFQGDFKS